MKAQDLRIGNKVITFDENNNDIEATITLVCITHCCFKEHNSAMTFEYIKPIPLTEEWLVKFGFEIKTWVGGRTTGANHRRILNGKIACFGLEYSCGEWWHDYVYGKCFGYASIEYVHQLQNLYFALTGEELTIK